MSSKANILNKLRRRESEAPSSTSVLETIPIVERDESSKVQRFCQMMEAVHTEIHHTSEADWLILLNRLFSEKFINNLLIAPATNIGKRLIQTHQIDVNLIHADTPVEQWKYTLFNQVDAGITGSRGAIADTGTIIIWPSAAEPRTLSLVPPIHIVLLKKSTISNTFAEILRTENWQCQMPTNALLISGPSKTADIQQTLAYGAHGPKELVVLLID